MDLYGITYDQLVLAILTTSPLRKLLIVSLPDRVAGPGGWLIDSQPYD